MLKIKFVLTVLFACFILRGICQRKAVFIILDGIPADVIEKVETPSLDEIAGKEGYTRAYLGGETGGYNQSPTVSAVGYNHLLTGTWSNKHNVWDNDIKAPNYHYWNIFRIAEKANPALTTSVFSSWTDNRTKLIGEGLEEAGKIKLDYSYDGLELDKARFPHTDDRKFMLDIDEQISREASRYILDKAPDLSWVYLEFTDDMGHMFGDSPQFYDAVKKADIQVGRIWQSIKERQSKYGEEWMIVVTTDHGRDLATGKDHGDQSERERTTWIVTNARPLNQRFRQNPATVDITPSLLRFMKIHAPEDIEDEFDGVPFIGKVSVSNLKATRKGDTVDLLWNVLDPSGNLDIWTSSTNNFASGAKDTYKRVGEINVSAGKFSFPLKGGNSDIYKILVHAPHNSVNTWVVKK